MTRCVADICFVERNFGPTIELLDPHNAAIDRTFRVFMAILRERVFPFVQLRHLLKRKWWPIRLMREVFNEISQDERHAGFAWGLDCASPLGLSSWLELAT
jgi:hypothetical protein